MCGIWLALDGGTAQALRTASLALVFAPAEYVSSAWRNSAHTHTHTNKPDVQLNQSLRIVTGSLKSTNLKWLPVLANITPPKIRRDVAARKEYRKFLGQEQSLLHHELVNPPPQRLKSRKPFYIDMVDEELDGDQLWRESWRTDPFPANGHLVNDL